MLKTLTINEAKNLSVGDYIVINAFEEGITYTALITNTSSDGICLMSDTDNDDYASFNLYGQTYTILK